MLGPTGAPADTGCWDGSERSAGAAAGAAALLMLPACVSCCMLRPCCNLLTYSSVSGMQGKCCRRRRWHALTWPFLPAKLLETTHPAHFAAFTSISPRTNCIVLY